MIIQLPFPGFYESLYSEQLDQEEESHIERYCEENDFDEKVYSDIIWKHRNNYSKAMEIVAEKYVECFNDWFKKEHGVDLELKFESLSSPREYNFTTDRVFAHISEEKVWELRGVVDLPTLRKAIRERFTSCDGFISHYSNRVEDWIDKPLLEWDHNELGTLLHAVFNTRDDGEDDMAVYYAMDNAEVFYKAFDASIDWPAVEQAVNEHNLIEAGECEDDGRKFPLEVKDVAQYVTAYCSLNGLKT